MNKLKTLVKSNLARDDFQIIFWANPTSQNFKRAMDVYSKASNEEKKKIEDRAYKKLQKQKQPQTSLAILYLLNCILNQGRLISLEQKVPLIDLSGCQTQKQKISEQKCYEIYYKYLRIQSLKPEVLLINPEEINDYLMQFCERAEESIHLIIHADFILLHCIESSKHSQLIQLIANKILEQVGDDLKFLNTFLAEKWELITNGHRFNFRINHIYERVIFFNKQMERLKRIGNKCCNKTKFPEFKFNKQMNKAIESEMYKLDEERKQFLSQKEIKFKPCSVESSQNMNISEKTDLMKEYLIQ